MEDLAPSLPTPERLTEILLEVSRGAPGAEDRLLDAVMADLRRSANFRLADPHSRSLAHPTELIGEAYVKLFGRDTPPAWENRAHFFASASRAMHQIIVDRARRQQVRQRALREGRMAPREGTDTVDGSMILALDEALDLLGKHYPRRRLILQLRFYAGLTTDEIAKLLDVGHATVERDWAAARAWLQRQLSL